MSIDEIAILIHELNDSAVHFISRDQYDRALSLLQKSQTLMDVSSLICYHYRMFNLRDTQMISC
jgi:hypothetical protein